MSFPPVLAGFPKLPLLPYATITIPSPHFPLLSFCTFCPYALARFCHPVNFWRIFLDYSPPSSRDYHSPLLPTPHVSGCPLRSLFGQNQNLTDPIASFVSQRVLHVHDSPRFHVYMPHHGLIFVSTCHIILFQPSPPVLAGLPRMSPSSSRNRYPPLSPFSFLILHVLAFRLS